MRKLIIIAIFAFCSSSAFGQGFPWEIFKPRTLKEIKTTTTKAFKPDDSMFFATTLLESKAEVIFTGKSRPILESRKGFIKMWAGMLSYPKDYPEKYLHEYLYKEGDDEYWLPTQEPVTKYFERELRPGDKMVLYLISIGAYKTDTDIDCVLLVEEYQIPKPPPKTDK